VAQLANQEARFIVHVVGLSGLDVTGLTDADFSFDLRRYDADADDLVASGETVAVEEIADGLYWVKLTPASTSERYRLVVAEGAFADSAGESHEFQFPVESGLTPSTGPWLSTRTAVKTALAIDGTGDDDRIDALLAAVTAQAETYCRRQFAQAERTEYPRVRGFGVTELALRNYPIAAIDSIYVSLDRPRVWGADQLLTADEEYVFDEDSGIVHRIDGCSWPCAPQAIRVVYTAGYETIPADLQRSAEEVIAAKLYKARDHQYHFTSFSKDDGTLTGIRFEDVPDNARAVWNLYRAPRAA